MTPRVVLRQLASGFFGALCIGVTALMLAACGGRLVALDKDAHGNLLAELATPVTPRSADPLPTVVLIERGGVRAVDPVLGKERWRHPYHVVAHPVASDDTIYLPVHGHRLIAVDRATGQVRWGRELPGEALTGMTVAGDVVVMVVVDSTRRGRSRIVALDTTDATLRWQRRSTERFGVPAAKGRAVVVPLADQVVAFRTASGREVARVDLPSTAPEQPALDRLSLAGDALMLGGGNRFVNLMSATGGRAPEPQRIDTGYGWLFQPIEGLDPGFDDAERLRLWVRFAVSGEAPRGAVLMARRAVVAMRLAPDGRPIKPRWVWRPSDHRELVGMHVDEHRITVVREDGSIVALAAASGQVVKRWAGQRATRGALLLDVDARVADPGTAPSEAKVRRQLAAMLSDDDPRLVPAQRLAADLLWRSDDLPSRALIEAIASGDRQVDSGDAAAELADHALDLMSAPWGRADADELQARMAALSERPSFLSGHELQLAPVARAAVHSGSREMVPHLVAHLLHPATNPAELTELAKALATLGGADAIDGLSTFVRRYHADPDVVYESRALHVAVDCLATMDDPDPALAAVLSDPFTEPDLRAYIAAQLDRPVAEAPHEAAPAQAPTTTASRDDSAIPEPPALHPPGL